MILNGFIKGNFECDYSSVLFLIISAIKLGIQFSTLMVFEKLDLSYIHYKRHMHLLCSSA